jgi:transcriptional/translational regulatory protein YebC/TACO1
MGQTGSVAFQFARKGSIEVPAEGHDEMELFELVAEAGGEDLILEEATFVITTPVETFGAVQAALREKGIEPSEASLIRVPSTTVSVEPDVARKVGVLIEMLEELQDVQAVTTTMQFDDSTIEALT